MNDIQQALDYHAGDTPGKLVVETSKPAVTQKDLSLAYSPGVAEPCKVVAENTESAYDYTWKGHTVAVISDGTAVLGLGDIGGLASLPVMEGKALLLKRFAGLNGVPIVLQDVKDKDGNPDVQKIVSIVKSISAGFGAINLEDIKAPYCFAIEDALQDIGIPVFHDDQHGTAIVVAAGILNALKLAEKDIQTTKVVVNGAGAAGIRIAFLLEDIGFTKENITVCDSRGVIYKGRAERMNTYKEQVAVDTDARSLADAVANSDVFVGVSVAGALTGEMVKTMNEQPIIFGLANPVPEIMPDEAKNAGAFVIATGRSDYANQLNNVLAFPGIFKGLLQTRAKAVTKEMKVAVVHALADLTHQEFDENTKEVLVNAYPDEVVLFEKENPLSVDYVVPKPLDPRVVQVVSEAVVGCVKDFE